ncbi:MAG: response regulator transcription factor [Psychrilyobacter sp.]|nr:response regulator transcription factor [Psychrilyobacter sp.]
MYSILIVEDEVKIARLMELHLSFEGYKVDVAHDGLEALSKIRHKAYDVIILDWMLPKVEGPKVCVEIKKFYPDTIVIMVTAKDDITDKISGFEFGADDYLTKPFESLELSARIKAHLRKMHRNSQTNQLNVQDLVLDLSRFVAIREEKDIKLSKTEFELLKLLIENKGIVLTRNKILAKIWGYDGSDSILDVYIKYLRDKIDKDFPVKLIKTVRGIGFTIEK